MNKQTLVAVTAGLLITNGGVHAATDQETVFCKVIGDLAAVAMVDRHLTDNIAVSLRNAAEGAEFNLVPWVRYAYQSPRQYGAKAILQSADAFERAEFRACLDNPDVYILMYTKKPV